MIELLLSSLEPDPLPESSLDAIWKETGFAEGIKL